MMAEKKDTSWDGVSDWYDDLLEGGDDTYQSRIVLPNLMRLLAPHAGMSILDVACGQGFFTREFANAGATVRGVDASAELIAIAQKRSPKIMWDVAPSHTLSGIESASFDAVTIILALQNIEDMNSTLVEVSRVLKTGGRFLFILNHPAFRIPKHSAWEFDEKRQVMKRTIDAYIGESRTEIAMHPGQSATDVTVSFHRPLQTYFKALGKVGFAVTRLEEWMSHKESERGPRAGAENRARNEFPLFLFIEATKH